MGFTLTEDQASRTLTKAGFTSVKFTEVRAMDGMIYWWKRGAMFNPIVGILKTPRIESYCVAYRHFLEGSQDARSGWFGQT